MSAFITPVIGGYVYEHFSNSAGIELSGSSLVVGIEVNPVCYKEFNMEACTVNPDKYRPDPFVLFAHTTYPNNDSQNIYLGVDAKNRFVLQTKTRNYLMHQLSRADRRLKLISPNGENIHLLERNDMILLEKDGNWSYQTINGTFDYRPSFDSAPDYSELGKMIFVKDTP